MYLVYDKRTWRFVPFCFFAPATTRKCSAAHACFLLSEVGPIYFVRQTSIDTRSEGCGKVEGCPGRGEGERLFRDGKHSRVCEYSYYCVRAEICSRAMGGGRPC